ncbi:DNA gyrase inhibitor YacG [Fuscibacter oryzae]|uniref:DNA gyrase inhibitor YacG n=1 Tax=Fuscibacter oryzae TaxID=2803939 RepID=A0A8J7SVG0_9RHOB|nr:DNA gyrase inhibitor YacG [Fuscibacter oryzae]MBL4927789.1 DNA gyrase inhibitor YacG [Fuscibacter oryzae]
MSCPICGKAADAKYRPFCSRRCADVDLGRWLTGGYALPAEDDTEETDAPPPAPPRTQ